MNNRECSVMRDLMPLCIDGAASDVSREMVVKHVWECEACAKAYAEMQGQLQASQSDDQSCLDEVAHSLRRRRKNQRRLLIALTVLLTAAAVIAGFFAWNYAFNTSQIPLRPDEYEAVLSRTQDGQILLHIYVDDYRLVYGLASGATMNEDGSYTLTVTPHATLMRSYFDRAAPGLRAYNTATAYWQDGLVWVKRSSHWDDAEPLQITCIRVATGTGDLILYRTGDDIPFCSPEMDAYYRKLAEFNEVNAEAAQRSGELNDEMTELALLVPEWR